MALDLDTATPPSLDVPLIVYVVVAEAPVGAENVTVAVAVFSITTAVGCAIAPSVTGTEEAVIGLDAVDVVVVGDLVGSFAVTVNV